MTSTLKKLERVQWTDTQIKLVIPQTILNQIKWLCKEIPKVEWSGVLFYSVKGSIKEPKDMVVTLEHIHPMQKGTTAYTEYAFDESVVEYMMANETMEKGWKIGHIHSHNTMRVYFSGTDWSELEDNAPNHNFYLSLIVNNFMDFCAKIGFIAKAEKIDFIAKDENGEKYARNINNQQITEKLIVYDCEIEAPINDIRVEKSFMERVKFIIIAAKKAVTATRTYTGYGRNKVVPINLANNSIYGKPNPGMSGWGNPMFEQNEPFTGLEDWEKEEVLEEEMLEEFTMFVLNTGNDISGLKTIEDVLTIYKTYSISATALTKGVLEKYSKVYSKFFDTIPTKDAPETFIEITKGVIEVIETELNTTTSKYGEKMLLPVKHGLENMLSKFIKYEFNTI